MSKCDGAPLVRVKKCHGCDEPYTTDSGRQMYCSKACKQYARNHDGYVPRRGARACETCNAEFPLDTKLGTRFCSRECQQVNARRNKLPQGLRDLNCWVCASDFASAKNTTQICSRTCYATKRKYKGKAILLEPPDGRYSCDECLNECVQSRWRIGDRIVCHVCAADAYQDRIVKRHRGPSPIGATRMHRGYVFEKVGKGAHHRADKNGWVPQHILVAERKFGFPVTREFTIHHKNRDPSDNRPENLDVRVGNHGIGGDVADTMLASLEMRELFIDALRRYGYEVTPGRLESVS